MTTQITINTTKNDLYFQIIWYF